MNNYTDKHWLCMNCNKNPRIVQGYFCPPCAKKLKAELEKDLTRAK